MRSALIILFNRDFTQNIPKLEALYGGRFRRILYVAPDHHSRFDRWYRSPRVPPSLARAADGLYCRVRRAAGRRNRFAASAQVRRTVAGRLHRVVGHQFFFYDFLRQIRRALLREDAEWYWVLGDDALLNPRLSESTMADLPGLSPENDCVLCRPVVGSDKWIERIAGSILRAREGLRRALGRACPRHPDLAIAAEPGALRNPDVAVGCADFFGFRRDITEKLLSCFGRCFRQRLYVELAVPNALLAVARQPAVVDRFLWRRGLKPGEQRSLAQELYACETAVFAHPVKLSAMPADAMRRLCLGAPDRAPQAGDGA